MKAFFYFCVFISCAPLLLLLILTVSTFWPYPMLFPDTVSLGYYQYVFSSNVGTLKAVVTTVLLAVFVAVITVSIAMPTARALAFHDFFGKGLVKMLTLVPLIVPGIAVAIGNQISMIKLGLAGTFFGVALVHAMFALPFAIRIMRNVFEAVGDRLEEQATVLGASPVFIFRHVTLPQIMPGILAASTLSFTISIAQYVTTFMVGGGRIITITMLLIPHIQGGQTHIAAVYSVLLIGASALSLYLMELAVRRNYDFNNVFYV